MPNKTKQNTKNSTKQKRSQPLYTTQTTHHTHPHPHHKRSRPAAQATTTPRAVDAHTVLNVNPTVCMLAKNTLCPTPQRTHTHHPTTGQQTHAGTRKQPQAPTQKTETMTVPHKTGLPRKEVIQPHLPVRLPCYDFVPIANPTFDHSPHKNG